VTVTEKTAGVSVFLADVTVVTLVTVVNQGLLERDFDRSLRHRVRRVSLQEEPSNWDQGQKPPVGLITVKGTASSGAAAVLTLAAQGTKKDGGEAAPLLGEGSGP
jgi:hypothetical protein